jgi:hypothetical protein
MNNKISKMESGLLNEGHKLYDILNSDQAPSWWKDLKEDQELYIDVRKGNILDVYYLGGRMAEIKYDRYKKAIIASAHPKYLGFNEAYYVDYKYYRKTISKDGETEYVPIYQDCLQWISERREEMKANIKSCYSGEDDGENTSEKYIQGNLVINHRDRYLDTEFAHRLYDGERKTVRIDLVKIEDDCFVFEELKRIGDYRLRTKDGKPEILEQMENYRLFLKHNKDELTNYYRTLYKIKRKLGLPIPPVEDIDTIEVNPEPQLLIARNYDKLSGQRLTRIDDIEKILQTINIKPNYI